MKQQSQIQPESEEEYQFLEMLVQARQYAIQEADLDKDDIVSTFAYFASGIAQEEDINPKAEFECPECSEGVMSHSTRMMGQDPKLVPCGCIIPWEDMPQDYVDKHFGL